MNAQLTLSVVGRFVVCLLYQTITHARIASNTYDT